LDSFRAARIGQVLLQAVEPEVPAVPRRARSVLLEVLFADPVLVRDVLERQPRLLAIGREPKVDPPLPPPNSHVKSSASGGSQRVMVPPALPLS
jgi:hypothetical protein